MSNDLRRRSSDSVSPALRSGAASPTSSGSVGQRQTSVRISSRRPTTSQASRSTGRSSGSRNQRSTSARTRRPTPVVRRQRRVVASEDNDLSEATEEDEDLGGRRRRRTVIGTSRRELDGAGNRRTTLQVTSSAGGGGGEDLRWYERLMPDFFLNMTAPITGYENRLDSDVEDDEYEILERQRLKRNRRVRRRLLALLLVATAASVFLYSRGRLFRKAGMKAAVSTMKHRIEGGLAKSIQETMGNHHG